ncbi:hypothetical protein, partial [Aeropyrum camini]|uniref:hypothetical protein n=1 Tax=Aeropyrum camini TaxID=229980 RepID=UPI00210DD65E
MRRVLEEVGGGEYTFVYGDVYLDSRFYGALASAEAPLFWLGGLRMLGGMGCWRLRRGLSGGVVE